MCALGVPTFVNGVSASQKLYKPRATPSDRLGLGLGWALYLFAAPSFLHAEDQVPHVSASWLPLRGLGLAGQRRKRGRNLSINRELGNGILHSKTENRIPFSSPWIRQLPPLFGFSSGLRAILDWFFETILRCYSRAISGSAAFNRTVRTS
ncbi:hypothetical protein MTR_6g017085 [Medicago truncatula]|uniref:Uncharacterized protein n=1 Tax=Medicago truncatula TaxID=3880 RepID=G7ZY48_MEDTR|nr:hypothetical protein MTR_6g017085 [Medicago truncatula]